MNGPEDLDRFPDVTGKEREALESILARALHPVDAPAGFTEAVLRRAGVRAEAAYLETHAVQGAQGGSGLRQFSAPTQEAKPLLGRIFSWPAARVQTWGAGALAAAALALAVFAGEQTHLRREQERGLERDRAQKRLIANQQFEASVRIMDETVGSIQEHAREQLRRAGVSGLE